MQTMKAVWERVLLDRRTGGWVLLVAGVVGVLLPQKSRKGS